MLSSEEDKKGEIVSIVHFCYGHKRKKVWLSTGTDNSAMLYRKSLTNEDEDMREKHAKDAQSLHLGV